MRISGAFPSKYLKASDLQGHIVNVQIERVEMSDVGTADEPDSKPVLYFVGKEKGLVLNKTNANTIAGMYGDDTDDWTEKWISLFEDETDFNGRRVACIRVRLKPPTGKQNGQAAKPAAAKPTKHEPVEVRPEHAGAGHGNDPIDMDDVPF